MKKVIPKRKSAYQKLKEKNELLSSHIHTLITKPNSLDAAILKGQYELNYGIQGAVWFGDGHLCNGNGLTIKMPQTEHKFEGLLSIVQRNAAIDSL